MAWFWPFITPFMKIFACGGLTISFKALFLMKKLLSKITCAAGGKFFGVEGGVTPLWFEKFPPPPSGKETTPPSKIFDLVHLCSKSNQKFVTWTTIARSFMSVMARLLRCLKVKPAASQTTVTPATWVLASRAITMANMKPLVNISWNAIPLSGSQLANWALKEVDSSSID